jgi:DNA-binding YbaB/EbfC family protein
MNIAKMMKQAQQMQADMQRTQETLSRMTVEASVAGGKVAVTATAAGEVVGLKIDAAVVDPADVGLLEDLVLSAVQQALAKGRETAAAEMQKVTGGLGLPGGFGL